MDIGKFAITDCRAMYLAPSIIKCIDQLIIVIYKFTFSVIALGIKKEDVSQHQLFTQSCLSRPSGPKSFERMTAVAEI